MVWHNKSKFNLFFYTRLLFKDQADSTKWGRNQYEPERPGPNWGLALALWPIEAFHDSRSGSFRCTVFPSLLLDGRWSSGYHHGFWLQSSLDLTPFAVEYISKSWPFNSHHWVRKIYNFYSFLKRTASSFFEGWVAEIHFGTNQAFAMVKTKRNRARFLGIHRK